jgi:hypothetical protein
MSPRTSRTEGDSVADRAPADDGVEPGSRVPVETFLLQQIRANPGLTFRTIIAAAQSACDVARSTAARHLARLMELGEVTLRPDGTYVPGELASSTARTAIELRRMDVHVVIHPDGSAWLLSRQEFRVVSGELDRIQYQTGKFMHRFSWWSTSPAQLRRISASLLPTREPMWEVRFAEPLRARDAAWHWVYAEGMYPRRYYRMAHDLPSRDRGRRSPNLEWEAEAIGVIAQAPRFARRTSPDANLRLQVVLPEGYPIRRVRCRVRVAQDRERTDPDEERRIARLARDALRQDGLRREGHAITLSVPHPLLDRGYTIEWSLPTSEERARWVASRRGLARLPETGGPTRLPARGNRRRAPRSRK